MGDTIHPEPREFTQMQLGTDPILRYFHYLHLPPVLQLVSGPFCELALHVVSNLPRNTERAVTLRKLLEAKDAAVRANVGALAGARTETFYDRLLAESKELEARLEKLEGFMGTFDFTNLPTRQRLLLQEQASVMRDYAQILGRRIAGIEPPAKVEKFEQVGDVKVVGGDKSEEPIPFS